MTFNGGKPHEVGYRGQQFEVSVFDEYARGRRVLGWASDSDTASKMATGAELRPSWSAAWVTDLFSDISHTQLCTWIGDRPLPAPQYLLLHTLPQGHDLRRAKLLGAQCRNLHSKEWRLISKNWGIAESCFDQLGDAWTHTTEFRRASNAPAHGAPKAVP